MIPFADGQPSLITKPTPLAGDQRTVNWLAQALRHLSDEGVLDMVRSSVIPDLSRAATAELLRRMVVDAQPPLPLAKCPS